MRVVSVICLVVAIGLALMPFWADSTPIYPPILGPLVLAPLWLFAAGVFWSAR